MPNVKNLAYYQYSIIVQPKHLILHLSLLNSNATLAICTQNANVNMKHWKPKKKSFEPTLHLTDYST